MKKLLSYQPLSTDVAALLLRLLVGGMFFFYHGYGKVTKYNEMLSQFPDLIGIGSGLSFHLTLFAEFICAALVLIGLFTRAAIIPIFITMAVAFFVAHASDPFGSKALPFVYMGLCLVIFVLGSGRFSADALLQRNQRA